MTKIFTEPCDPADHKLAMSSMFGQYCTKCGLLGGWRGHEAEAPPELVRAGKARDIFEGLV